MNPQLNSIKKKLPLSYDKNSPCFIWYEWARVPRAIYKLESKFYASRRMGTLF
jgi:hypothetical protein